MKTPANPIARRVIFFALLLLAWQGLAWANVWPEYVFPSPMGVGQALLRGVQNSSLPVGILASLQRLLVGFAISAVLGIGLGLALGRNRLLNDTLGSLVLGLQALPSICWLPLALIWFGLSETAMIFVVVMGAVFSITLATKAGVKNTLPLYLRAAANMGAKGFDLYRLVILPAALPAIITGLKMGWSFAWRSLMAAELLYVSIGLGHLLTMGRELNDMSQVIAVMLVIIALGLVVDRMAFGRLEARIRERWGL